jgi:hypothetical protein
MWQVLFATGIDGVDLAGPVWAVGRLAQIETAGT